MKIEVTRGTLSVGCITPSSRHPLPSILYLPEGRIFFLSPTSFLPPSLFLGMVLVGVSWRIRSPILILFCGPLARKDGLQVHCSPILWWMHQGIVSSLDQRGTSPNIPQVRFPRPYPETVACKLEVKYLDFPVRYCSFLRSPLRRQIWMVRNQCNRRDTEPSTSSVGARVGDL